MQTLIDFVLHIDVHLDAVIRHYGGWTYAVLGAVIFAETGFVVTPFLPGDSLLFAAGTLAARGSLQVGVLVVLLAAAAIAGDSVNYWMGSAAGSRVLAGRWSRVVKPEYLERTHRFYERYGSLTIVLARFVPVVRTFAPFVAGVGAMAYGRFFVYNVVGGIAWVASFVFGGYVFGNIPAVQRHFTLVVAGIIAISILPAVLEVVKHRRRTAASR